MFSFYRRRMKLGRVKKVQLSDSARGFRSPIRPPKRPINSNAESAEPSNSSSVKLDCHCPSTAPEINNCKSGSSDNWMELSVTGEKPVSRLNHAVAVVGNRMIVVGGESVNGLLDDVQVLNFDKFSWSRASSKLYLSPSSLPLKIPACKGHSLVSWGKKVLLVGGKTDPASDRVSVWAFDTETECWSLVEAKGDIPVARSGHTVVRASSILILFGGEDAKKRKLNDLHMFDLKSLTWLPLHCTGTGPSPRSNHVAALYAEKTIFIFGGASKSKTLNDLYSLDFETRIWSRIKIRGFHPSPRAGCCGALCGTKWYIAAGGSRKKRHAETLIFDILKLEWSLVISSPPSSITANKGFSLVLVQHKDKDFLVAFGGSRKEPSNQVEVLIMEKNESSMGRQSIPSKCATTQQQLGKNPSSTGLATPLGGRRSVDSAPKQKLASLIEHGRKSLSELSLIDHDSVSGSVSLRKQFHREEECSTADKIPKGFKDENSVLLALAHRINQSDLVMRTNVPMGRISLEDSSLFESESSNLHLEGIGNLTFDNDNAIFPESDSNSVRSAPSSTYQYYDTTMAAVIRKNGILEGQLAAALAGQDAAEKNLSAALKSRQEMEKKLSDTMKEKQFLKEKLAGVELAKEEANSLSNIVHSDTIRLEHDVAFLRAVLDDTQKELHSTRGVLAGEKARAFQLQVEVFHLKQRLQSMENRAPRP